MHKDQDYRILYNHTIHPVICGRQHSTHTCMTASFQEDVLNGCIGKLVQPRHCFIEILVPRNESNRACIYALRISILPVSAIVLLYFGTFPSVLGFFCVFFFHYITPSYSNQMMLLVLLEYHEKISLLSQTQVTVKPFHKRFIEYTT